MKFSLFPKTTSDKLLSNNFIYLLVIVLIIMSQINYLFFHTTVEMFSIMVSFVIFSLTSRTYKYSANEHLLFMGYSYLFLSILTLFHLCTYFGISIFTLNSPNVSTQFWIASRYLLAISTLLGLIFIKHKVPKVTVMVVYSIISFTLILSIMVFKVFPNCYIEEYGLTAFKIISEYVISAIFALALFLLYIQSKRNRGATYKLMFSSVVLNIFAELCFTLYKTPYDFFNFFGHILVVASYYLIFEKIFMKGVQAPYKQLEESYDKIIEGWGKALEIRDFETKGHSERVAQMTVMIAELYGLNDGELVNIKRGALLHDIGKIGVPDSILLKKGPLTEEEWDIMKKHPEYAYKLLSSDIQLTSALDIPYRHHEKWDGSGYPGKLKGEEIPVAARIFAVVDVWDALTSDRPYRKAWSEDAVKNHISSLSGSHFDPKIVDLFIENYEYLIGSKSLVFPIKNII